MPPSAALGPVAFAPHPLRFACSPCESSLSGSLRWLTRGRCFSVYHSHQGRHAGVGVALEFLIVAFRIAEHVVNIAQTEQVSQRADVRRPDVLVHSASVGGSVEGQLVGSRSAALLGHISGIQHTAGPTTTGMRGSTIEVLFTDNINSAVSSAANSFGWSPSMAGAAPRSRTARERRHDRIRGRRTAGGRGADMAEAELHGSRESTRNCRRPSFSIYCGIASPTLADCSTRSRGASC